MSSAELRSIIDNYIKKQGAIRIYYRNNNGQTSIRVVEPLRWDNDYVFLAFCNLRNEERFFKLSNILEWQCFDSVDGALAYDANPPESSVNLPTVLPNQRTTQQPSGTASKTQYSPKPFDTVSSSAEWSRLLGYYGQCLIREYQQQYELKKEFIRPFKIPSGNIDAFLQGGISLEFKIGYQLQQDPIVQFIQKNQRETNMQLCIGYPFLVVGTNKIYPLIYSPLDINANRKNYRLQAETYEISYAALNHLKMEPDEILNFLEECDQVTPQPEESVIDAQKRLLIEKINDVYQTQLPHRADRLEPISFYDGPALFRITGNQITGNLIQELDDLSKKNWEQVPSALKQLLTVQPDHEYPSISKDTPNKNLYVTAINQQQIQALNAARTEPVLIVTGPPGTGKSQLVLNLIAQSFMAGESVLFASRNNRAVDVVMSRLQNELNFQGAVRTGRKSNREQAVQQMKSALSSIIVGKGLSELSSIEDEYQKAQEASGEAKTQLEEVRKLSGLMTSYQTECKDYLSFLPKKVSKLVEANTPSFQANEIEHLQDSLQGFLSSSLEKKEIKANLEAELQNVERENSIGSDLIDTLLKFEDQWGTFGEGFIKRRQYQTLNSLEIHMKEWGVLIQVIDLWSQRNQVLSEVATLRDQLSSLKLGLPIDLIDQLERRALGYPVKELKNWASISKNLTSWFIKNAETPSGFWKKIHHWIKFGRHFKKQVRQHIALEKKLGIERTSKRNINKLGRTGLATVSNEKKNHLGCLGLPKIT